MGHAVPMPVVVQTRTYDEDFYQAVKPASSMMTTDERINLLRGAADEGIE
jgi:hypothetical protein